MPDFLTERPIWLLGISLIIFYNFYLKKKISNIKIKIFKIEKYIFIDLIRLNSLFLININKLNIIKNAKII